MARRSSRFHTRGQRRKTNWTQSAQATDFTALAANTLVLQQRFTAATILSEMGAESTVIRTRGVFQVWADQAASAENAFGALGMAIVSEQAAVAGAASIPDPYSDALWDGWFVHQYFSHSIILADATGLATPAGTTYEINSKAMRKVQDNETVVVMITNASATDGMRFTIDFRMLFKLA